MVRTEEAIKAAEVYTLTHHQVAILLHVHLITDPPLWEEVYKHLDCIWEMTYEGAIVEIHRIYRSLGAKSLVYLRCRANSHKS